MNKDVIQTEETIDGEYEKLVEDISSLWSQAKEKAIHAVNSQLLEANWQTGKYIVEYEQGGKARAEYGKQLLLNLSKDLTLKTEKDSTVPTLPI